MELAPFARYAAATHVGRAMCQCFLEKLYFCPTQKMGGISHLALGWCSMIAETFNI